MVGPPLFPILKKDQEPIDWLKENSVKIHFFGLGFIQVKFADGSRYHFYHPDLDGFVDNPHNHRYDFTSCVLMGELTQDIWRIVDEGTEGSIPAIKKFESCSLTVLPPDTRENVWVKKVASVDSTAMYFMDNSTFHQVKRSGPDVCVTYVQPGPKLKDFATVLLLNGKEEACPFSGNKPESELWEIVHECVL